MEASHCPDSIQISNQLKELSGRKVSNIHTLLGYFSCSIIFGATPHMSFADSSDEENGGNSSIRHSSYSTTGDDGDYSPALRATPDAPWMGHIVAFLCEGLVAKIQGFFGNLFDGGDKDKTNQLNACPIFARCEDGIHINPIP